MNAKAQALPPEDDLEMPAVYPGEFQPLLQSLLATLADIDFAFERDLETARSASTEESLKRRIIERLVDRHRERREPYIQQLTTLQCRIRRFLA